MKKEGDSRHDLDLIRLYLEIERAKIFKQRFEQSQRVQNPNIDIDELKIQLDQKEREDGQVMDRECLRQTMEKRKMMMQLMK